MINLLPVQQTKNQTNFEPDDPPEKKTLDEIALESQSLLDEVLATMTRRQRQAFDLYFEKSLGRGETGKRLGIKRAGLCKLIQRIRERFHNRGLSVPSHPAEPADFVKNGNIMAEIRRERNLPPL